MSKSKKLKLFKKFVEQNVPNKNSQNLSFEQIVKSGRQKEKEGEVLSIYKKFFNALKEKNWDEVYQIVEKNPQQNFNKKLNFQIEYQESDLILNNYFAELDCKYADDLGNVSPLSYFILEKQNKLFDLFLKKYPVKNNQIFNDENKTGDYPFSLLTACLIKDDAESFNKLMPQINKHMFYKIDEEINYITDAMYDGGNLFYPKKMLHNLKNVSLDPNKDEIPFNIGKIALRNNDVSHLEYLIKNTKNPAKIVSEYYWEKPNEIITVIKNFSSIYYKVYNELPTINEIPLVVELFNHISSAAALKVVSYFNQFEEFKNSTSEYIQKNGLKNISLCKKDDLSVLESWGLDWKNYSKNGNVLHHFLVKQYKEYKVGNWEANDIRKIKDIKDFCSYVNKTSPELFHQKNNNKTPLQILNSFKIKTFTQFAAQIELAILKTQIKDQMPTKILKVGIL